MKYLLSSLLTLITLPALAQDATAVDPRLAGPMIVALRGDLALRDALIKVLQDDAKKREEEWAAYSKSLWASPPALSQQEPAK